MIENHFNIHLLLYENKSKEKMTKYKFLEAIDIDEYQDRIRGDRNIERALCGIFEN